MRKALIILAVQISTIGSLIACGCKGPMNDLKTDIDSSYAIFIGVITEISKSHVFHLNDGIGTGLAFINFDVLKSYRRYLSAGINMIFGFLLLRKKVNAG